MYGRLNVLDGVFKILYSSIPLLLPLSLRPASVKIHQIYIALFPFTYDLPEHYRVTSEGRGAEEMLPPA